jgi:hypothetical protein
LKEGKKIVRKKFLAALILNGANETKYNNLKRSMKENFVTWTSTYPKSPEAVLRILNAYQPLWMEKVQAGHQSGDQRRSYICSNSRR